MATKRGAEWWEFLAGTLVIIVVVVLVIILYLNIKSGGEFTIAEMGKKIADLIK